MGQMLHEVHSKVTCFNFYWMNIHLSLCLIHGMIFLGENVPYNLSIFCRFKVQLIFEGAKFLKGNQYDLDSWVPLPDYFEVIRYYWHAKKSKKYFKAKINIFHLCPTNVSAWALKFPPSQKSVYLETGVLLV